MSDFLTQLASQAIQAERSIRPRLASRFEPAAGVPRFITQAGASRDLGVPVDVEEAYDSADANPDSPRASERTWKGRQNTTAPASRTTEVPGVAIETAAGPTDAERNAPARLPLETTNARTQPGEDNRQRAAVPPPLPPPTLRGDEGETGSVQEISEESSKRARSAGESRQPAARARDLPVRSIADEADVKHLVPSVHLRLNQSEIRPGATPGAAAAIRPAVPPRLEPSVHVERPAGRASEGAPSKSPDAAEREPDIHITIGRIEVRAVSAVSLPRPVAAPAGPRVTLEDYLKARNGGAA